MAFRDRQLHDCQTSGELDRGRKFVVRVATELSEFKNTPRIPGEKVLAPFRR